jgi:hypothetical protein
MLGINPPSAIPVPVSQGLATLVDRAALAVDFRTITEIEGFEFALQA